MNTYKFTVLALVISIFASPFAASAYVSVDGYYRNDGTYVQPHVRSEPNGIRYDNYGYDGGSMYNDSYGSSNYGSDWNTPSWNTDVDYYEGESLYESNSISSYDYSSSYDSYNSASVYDSYDSYDSYGSYGSYDSYDSGYGSYDYSY